MKQKLTKGSRPPPLEDEAVLEPVMIRLPPAMMREIEALQRERLDAPNKSTISRELLASALEAKKACK
jgi:hypothetical protein